MALRNELVIVISPDSWQDFCSHTGDGFGIGLAGLPVSMRSFQQLQKYCVLADEVSWIEVSHQRCVLSAGEKGSCQ